MGWKDDLLPQVTYTSPSGKAFSFNYDNGLTRETDLKTATFTFPGVDGAYIQPLGRGGRRFPFSCTFYGENCINDADAFEAALCESGYGELQYPSGQKYKVVPTGTIKRGDNPVTAANQSTVEITFAETITDEKFPSDSVQSGDEVEAAAADFEQAAAEEFAQALAVDNISELLNVRAVMEEQERTVSAPLEKIVKESAGASAFAEQAAAVMNSSGVAVPSAAAKSAAKTFAEIKASLEENIEAFADDIKAVPEKAFIIAMQTSKIANIPARTSAPVLSKIEGYAQAVQTLVRNFSRIPIGLNNLKNQYAASKLQLQSLVVGVAAGISSLAAADESEGGFASREDAVTAAVELANLADAVQTYCDSRIKAIQAAENEKPKTGGIFAETAESYTAMKQAAALAVAQVLNHSFALKMRRIITLDRDRQLLELLAELYGSVDEHLDEFIIDNRLNIDEIALIPAGREVAYYG